MPFPGAHRLPSQLKEGTAPTDNALVKTPNGWILAHGETVPPDEIDGYAPGGMFVHTDGADMASTLYQNTGSKASSRFLRLGVGGMLRCLEETVDLTAAGAKFVAMAAAIPAGAVIIGAQANIQTAVTAGGTTVKVALGLHGVDVDLYGKSTGLTKNLKIDTVPDWAVLGTATTIDVCGVTTSGAALGSANLSAGTVRVRIMYLDLTSLPNA